MTGYIVNKAGVQTELPELLSWDVCHGIGEPCDWFEVSFIYYSSQLSDLRAACGFVAKNGTATVFTGIVDEFSVSIDKNGSVVTVSGRSNAARLLDNELGACEYAALSSAEMISDFIAPFGISSVTAGTAKTVNAFTVSSGESAWSAVRRFCRYAWNTVPFFAANGDMILNDRQGSTLTVDALKDAASIDCCFERYGIISDICVKNRVTGTSYTINNDDFISAGGRSHRELTVPKTTGADAARYTAQYQIAESMRGKNTVKLWLTRQFACFPGDRVALTAAKLGVSGIFKVISSHCWADSVSAGTIVTLEV